jgi:cytochrome c553
MRKVLKWIGIILASLVGLLLVAAVALFAVGSARLNKIHNIQVETLAIPTNETAVVRGRHLAEAVTLCIACHGDDLGGTVLDDEPGIVTISASNLTSGQGGVGATYSDDDYVRAIRHGANPEGRGLIIMHSDIYHNLSAEDLGAIIAYIKTMPPVDRELPTTRARPLGSILVALGMFDMETMPLIPAEVIDHSASFAAVPAPGMTAGYGHYLVTVGLCTMCHRGDLNGGPPLEPESPPVPNIAVYGGPGGWSEAEFVNTIRTGVTPYGKSLDPESMPWEFYQNMTDEELGAIWRYLQSVAGE